MEREAGRDAERAEFAGRRRRVLEALGEGAMVLPAAAPLVRSRDSELPYRPDSELYYLTGLEAPGTVLVLRGFADEARTILFALPRDAEAERWSGPRLGPEEAGARIEADEAHDLSELPQRLPKLLAGARDVHFRLGQHPRVEPLVLEALQEARGRGARSGRGPDGVVDPGRILDELRMRKSPPEIERLREAVRVTMLGMRAGLAATAPGCGEWEIQAAVEAAFRSAGGAGAGPAFATIVGAGANACVLHYAANASRAADDDLVLLDAGAEVRMYAGDLTRTFPASGRFGPEQRAVYEVVEAARTAAVERVRPGARADEPHEAAVGVLLEGLVELGVLSGSLDELRERGAHRSWFPHRTCHWLGLDTHDPGNYALDGESRVLEPGMVLTVEPGLYFPPAERSSSTSTPTSPPKTGHPFAGIGVRIEDDVVVTPGGHEVLSAGLPTAPDALAELVGR